MFIGIIIFLNVSLLPVSLLNHELIRVIVRLPAINVDVSKVLLLNFSFEASNEMYTKITSSPPERISIKV